MTTHTTIDIENRTVGEGRPMFLIAEVGLAHDGSLGAAHAFVESAAACGVDAVKFQTHIASEESSKYEQFRVNVFPQDATRTDYWTRTAFEKNQWQELAAHCREQGVVFLSSPFSEQAVEWLEECDMPAWKIASGEVTNLPMLKMMVETKKPILVSSGMSSWDDLDQTVEYLESLSASLAVFQCTTAYPCPPETWGLNVIGEMLAKYKCPVGLSDHSGTIFPGLAAKMLGASMLEFHVTFHKSQFGPDTKASLTFDQTRELVEGIRAIETAINHPVDKDEIAKGLAETKRLFSKGLFAAKDLPVGHRLARTDILIRKPLMEIPAADMELTIGKVVAKAVEKGEPIPTDHLESK